MTPPKRWRVGADALPLLSHAMISLNVPARLYHMHKANEDMTTCTNLPELPNVLVYRLNGIKFKDLSPGLQRALLWDTGLVLSLDGSRFVQILIASGYSVLNVIVSPDIIQDVGGCSLKDKCKRDTICYALEDCSASSLYNLTQCAVHEITSVSSISGSLWSEHNDIAAGSDFRIFGQEGSSTLYKILENPSVLVQDFPCPSSPTSIIPWRQVSRSDPKWSMSTQDSLVDIWVMEESQRTCNILAVVFMALFGLSVVVLVLLLV